MKQYGTADLFVEKVAGTAPLLARLGMALLNYKLVEDGRTDDAKQRVEDELRQEARLELERAQMGQATQALKHTPVPGDEGMTRLASIAADIGRDFAKKAGVAPIAGDLLARGKQMLTGGLGAKANLALAGGAIAAGTLATKGLQGASRVMAREPAGPAVFGMGRPSATAGYQIPFGVNQYGQPQAGTSL
jgi:hypothetical protein